MAWGNIGRWLTCDSAHSWSMAVSTPSTVAMARSASERPTNSTPALTRPGRIERGISDFALDSDADPVAHRGELDRHVATDQLELRRVDITQRYSKAER